MFPQGARRDGDGAGKKGPPLEGLGYTRTMAMDKTRIRVFFGVTTLCGSLFFANPGPTSAASDFELVAAARSAGASLSTRVFEETTGPVPDDSERERERPVVSGKMVLLGAAMVSAAIVGAAFILRDRCEPMSGGFLRFPRVRAPPVREGLPTPPPPPLPPIPLPDMCVPR